MDDVRSLDELKRVVKHFSRFDSFVFDVETKGPHRGDPIRNEVFWISLGGPGIAVAIPCGHPIGERVVFDHDDPLHRVSPQGKFQERRINPASGREKWFDIPEPFTKAPSQLWVSDVMGALEPLMFSERRKINHNIKFDVKSVAKYYGGAVPLPPYGDTVVAAKLVNETFNAYDLGSCIRRAFHYSYEKIGKRGVENFPYSEACLYSYLDSKYTWLLWRSLEPKLDAQNVRAVYDMEMDLLPVLIDMEMTGVNIDLELLAKFHTDFNREMAGLQLDLDEAAGTEINLNATKQLAELVYTKRKHRCKTFSPKTRQPSVTKESLEEFSKDPIVAKVLEFKAIKKLQSTFIEALDELNVEGRIHPNFNQTGAVSGRLSCSEPNIQQIPSRTERGKQIRQLFTAPPKHLLIVSDLSQIELRVLAHFTQDPKLLKAYREGLDLHGRFAEVAFQKDYTPLQRTIAKNVHFAVLFGSGPDVLVRKYGVESRKLAERLLKLFYTNYRRVRPWKESVISDARNSYRKGARYPYVQTILGRKRRLPELMLPDERDRWGAERQAVSVTISGSAADLFKLSMIDCFNALNDYSCGAHILMTIHDELVVEVPERHAEDCLQIVKSTMENVENPFTGEPILSVPIVADAKLVERWGDAK